MKQLNFCKEIKNASDDISSDAKAKKLVRLVFDTVALLVALGETVVIDGFGRFVPVVTKERTGKNPQTGESMQIAAAKKVTFKPAAALKRLVKGEES